MNVKKSNSSRKNIKPEGESVTLAPEAKESRCPCGGECVVLIELPETDHAGVTESGRYTSIRRRRMQCQVCGTVSIDRSYHYDPSKWRE